MTIGEVLRRSTDHLAARGSGRPRLEAERLLAHALGLERVELYMHLDRPLSVAELDDARALVRRRADGEPLQYVLGEWGFRRLMLAVDGRALVPRPETEGVVERCLVHLRGLASPRVLDVGTGSGAIALAIADEHPGARVIAVDRADGALALARDNLARAAVNGRVELRQGDLLEGLAGPFDLIVSNPPYVPAADYDTLQPEIRLYEPYEAVVGDGVWREIARDARALLAPGGHLVLEVGDGQAAEVAEGLAALGYEEVHCTPDLAGRDRTVEGRRP